MRSLPRGVYARYGKFRVEVSINGVLKSFGTFDNIGEANRAAIAARATRRRPTPYQVTFRNNDRPKPVSLVKRDPITGIRHRIGDFATTDDAWAKKILLEKEDGVIRRRRLEQE